jgi:hypothetical protein
VHCKWSEKGTRYQEYENRGVGRERAIVAADPVESDGAVVGGAEALAPEPDGGKRPCERGEDGLDARTGNGRYGARRLAKPERRQRRAPATSRVVCGSEGTPSSPAPGTGAAEEEEDMAEVGRTERRRGAKRRVEAKNGDGVGTTAVIGFVAFESSLDSAFRALTWDR